MPEAKTALTIPRWPSGVVFALTLAVAAAHSLEIAPGSVAAGSLVASLVAGWVIRRAITTRVSTIMDGARGLARATQQAAEREQRRLEALAAARAEEVRERDAALRSLLEHVGQGVASIDRDGVLVGERSRALDAWFGAPPPGITLWAHLRATDPLFGDALHVAWQLWDEPDLPLDIVIEALPRTLRKGGRFFRFDYRAIDTPRAPDEQESASTRLMVLVSDVTAEVERRRAEEARRELVTLLERLRSDRGGCVEFVRDTDRLLAELRAASTPAAYLHVLHTVKANSSLFGQQALVDLCHTTEAIVRATAALPSAADAAELFEHWSATKAMLAPLLGDARVARPEISAADYEALRSAIPFAPRQELARMVARWQLEPVATRFMRLSRQAIGLASRLGKAGVRVVTDAKGIRLDRERWAPFWSCFAHVVRNAVDHGVESARERAMLQKLNEGVVVLRAYTARERFVVEIADDGRGIDWNALEARARELGIYTRDRAQLEELLFRDGVTTREVADESSGTGLGLGAAREACRALGGRVQVESKVNGGTLVRFVFPIAAMDATAPRAALASAA